MTFCFEFIAPAWRQRMLGCVPNNRIDIDDLATVVGTLQAIQATTAYQHDAFRYFVDRKA